MSMLHGWDNFFILAGRAAATLIGLLLVAVTVGLALFHLDNQLPNMGTPALGCCQGNVRNDWNDSAFLDASKRN